MRLVLILLALLAALPWPAEAQSRARMPGLRGPHASGAALEAARRFLCPHGGVPQGRGRCAPASGGGMPGGDPDVRGWDRGIAAPTRAQAPCPPGTTASTARAQPGVTRCIAG
ncbi:hypothetical protein EJV46_14755 [Roseococcus sp. SYP-B2431]|uniref:hypothetical protein n=1 Tax=Roseococcus sp. SYP-B2431 TaxID=2496640 RepID=UPI00103A3D70|nr:hypothetical protein [Roseococcus sp. SYP-B2431]TCH97394.1 hypothetical protein EJV46_14755 [Roseococcus sp. SYP-B2431]